MRQSFIFRCSSSTEDECFERMLFGEVNNYKDKVKLVRKGDTLFLYSVTTRRLFGEFIATSDGAFEIEPNAWDSSSIKFPWQVKVDWKKQFNQLERPEIENIVKFRGRYPEFSLTKEQAEHLTSLLEKAIALPSSEKEFRLKFPQDHRADDGHFVRSQAETNIDNWLFNQQICHGYERKLPVPENVYCDFYIPSKERRGFVYIEYWGREDEIYQDRKKTKLEIYKKYNFPLIEIFPQDLEILDDVMPRKLRAYFKDLTLL